MYFLMQRLKGFSKQIIRFLCVDVCFCCCCCCWVSVFFLFQLLWYTLYMCTLHYVTFVKFHYICIKLLMMYLHVWYRVWGQHNYIMWTLIQTSHRVAKCLKLWHPLISLINFQRLVPSSNLNLLKFFFFDHTCIVHGIYYHCHPLILMWLCLFNTCWW